MGEQPGSGPGRRRVLVAVGAVAGLTATAGCAGLYDQTGATDVIVSNAADGPRTVSVTITDANAESVHTSRTLELDSGDLVDPVNRSKLPTNTGYTVAVSVENGPEETFEWSDPDVELAPLWVRIDDTRNVKFLLQAG